MTRRNRNSDNEAEEDFAWVDETFGFLRGLLGMFLVPTTGCVLLVAAIHWGELYLKDESADAEDWVWLAGAVTMVVVLVRLKLPLPMFGN